MKTVLVSLLSALSLNAMASDVLTDEIVCKSVNQPGVADASLTVVVKSNATAWKKQALLIENGYLGSRQVGSFQIPLQPTVKFNPKFGTIETYQTEDFTLDLAVFTSRAGQKVYGPGLVKTVLPGSGTVAMQLTCQSVK